MRFLPVVFFTFIVSLLSAAEPVRTWERWDGCTHLADRYFDGDSFQIKYSSQAQIIRLYGVDAPETDAGLGTRIDEQAAYFGVKPADVLKAGAEAKEFTGAFLSKTFQVTTRRKIAPGASRTERFYGLVERNGIGLDTALISAGLARATTEPADYPDAAAGHQHLQQLRILETKARQERRGLWGKSARNLSMASLKEQLTPRLLKPNTPPPLRTVNVNTATAMQLESLPGVGPKTAQEMIRARPIKDLGALDALPGFGPKKLDALREVVSF